MRKTDARIRYTQSVLKQALLSFLKEKPINKITVKEGKRSIIPRYRKVVVPGAHTTENHDFISSDQGSRSSISKSLPCSVRSGSTLNRWSR